jgi:tetratricopeptide (TPR) repeat protein
LSLLIRYAAVFSHDVAEGLPGPLKSLALFMAVLFLALPLAGFMGWGYLPFWWMTLLFIFASREERAVSLFLIVALGLSSLALPLIEHQRSVEAATEARTLHLLAGGGTSVEAEALVEARLTKDPTDAEWSLLSANLLRRGGRFDEAAAALRPKAAADPRFEHNAAVLAFSKEMELKSGNYEGARQGFTRASESAASARDKATALYNLSLVQANTLDFDGAKATRAKGDALDGALLARHDRLFAFDRDGSTLQSPPDIVPNPDRLVSGALPTFGFTVQNAFSRLSVIALVLLLLIPTVMRFRGAQSFSKQCPKCGATFCWLCQTRSTSQDVCSQCHHLFVVKRGIPPAAKAAKNAEISAYITRKALSHRLASVLAPGSGHLSVGHFSFGLPVLLVWALCVGGALTLHFLAPLILSAQPVGSMFKIVFAVVAAITYILAQAVQPQAPVVAPPPRRTRAAEQEA